MESPKGCAEIMVRPNFIPRTLRGVGGVRLYDIPGVTYPKEVLVIKAGFNHKDGQPYPHVPGWGVTSREAAQLLGNSPSAARTWLHRRKVPFRFVDEGGQTLRLYWRKDRVEELAKQRLPIIKTCPSTLITASEARRILHIGRSSLHRYQEKGRVKAYKVRKPSGKGLRTCSYFDRDEIQHLAKHLGILREKETELQQLRSQSSTPPPPSRPPYPTTDTPPDEPEPDKFHKNSK